LSLKIEGFARKMFKICIDTGGTFTKSMVLDDQRKPHKENKKVRKEINYESSIRYS
jgi:N-methylhydantoinase A/oxoprolinase/acetone carboxylase beta subunit